MASSAISSNANQEGIQFYSDYLFLANSSEDGGKSIPNDENVLQKHVAFFDRNHDGVVYPWETFQGFRAIGCGILLSTGASLFINIGLSSKTRTGRSKHGSDSGVYDSEGRFVHSKFEEIFRKHAHNHPDALTSDELMGMLRDNRQPKDYGGWIAAYAEWKILVRSLQKQRWFAP
ncbi:Caleosin-related family protein [Melia azedarach]|uniref:Caleosin-related family protein n=1 Tax=Melia azedarach TaxID=155640 RepID=A0ACC1XFA6_MELAZ|nr:Caleosin-related family protein [Melia azedarach]